MIKATFWGLENNQPGMRISSYSDEDSEIANKVIKTLQERDLKSTEENYNIIMKELGFKND